MGRGRSGLRGTGGGQLTNPAELDEFCLQHLARFKRPRDYRVIEKIPKNSYGKVLKTALRELDQETAQLAGDADGRIGGSSSG